MTSRYRLRFSRLAAQDLDETFEYIALILKEREAAKKLMRRIEQEVRQLQDFPKCCELCRDEVLSEMGYRRLVVGNYVIIYEADEKKEEILIVRVFYGRQDYTQYIK